ncbi:MAG: hypothetical protein CMI02_00600 [Oceanospirillaceae bacterium]|nr:hypothetical protein [Oceanospirillaceae bacterium]MBT10517.1 hypothetical protein [Oceanospirillaceae bacterium]|tara:strand:- start:98618 stop:99388 length:771 start_codon:yes stop_codon:yes gene_type:complete
MFRAIWAARWYLLLGLFTFIFVLAINTPLHFVWGFVEPQVKRLPVNIHHVNGTLWDGHAKIGVPQMRALGELQARWTLSPLSLLTGAAAVNLQVEGQGLRLQADTRIGMDQQLDIHSASGYLDSAVVAPVLKKNRISVGGNFELSQLSGELNLAQRRFADISGRVVYSGGEVSVPVNNKPVQATMPMVLGNIAMEGNKAVITATTTDNKELLQAYMQPDGWGGVAVRRRFIDALGQEWPNKAEEDTVIFEVSHKIL